MNNHVSVPQDCCVEEQLEISVVISIEFALEKADWIIDKLLASLDNPAYHRRRIRPSEMERLGLPADSWVTLSLDRLSPWHCENPRFIVHRCFQRPQEQQGDAAD